MSTFIADPDGIAQLRHSLANLSSTSSNLTVAVSSGSAQVNEQLEHLRLQNSNSLSSLSETLVTLAKRTQESSQSYAAVDHTVAQHTTVEA